jgi:hypothetical protein
MNQAIQAALEHGAKIVGEGADRVVLEGPAAKSFHKSLMNIQAIARVVAAAGGRRMTCHSMTRICVAK